MALDKNVDINIQEVSKNAKITVIGVGGGGSNMVSHLFRVGTHPEIELIVANTDIQHLNASPVAHKIQLGERTTSGLGAGADDEAGKKAALESTEDIKAALNGSDMVIICAGLGGGTGTGAAPVVAKIAKDIGALTVSIVTKPFAYEAKSRAKRAKKGLEDLKEVSDSIIVVPNDRIRSIVSKSTGFKDSYALVNDVLARAANGISSVILNFGETDMNVDFADVRKIMSFKGLALMGTGEGKGDNACIDALRSAIESPLFDNLSINGAMGIIVNFEFNPNYPFMQVEDTMMYVSEAAHEDAEIIQGTIMNENIPEDEIRVTIIATGFERNIITNTDTQEPHTESDNKPKATSAVPYSLDSLFKVSGGDSTAQNLDDPSYLRLGKD